MSAAVAVLLLAIAAVAVCALALVKGAQAERFAAMAILISIPVGLLIQRIPEPLAEVVSLSGDGVIALFFLGLTIRFATWWLGAVMLLYAAQFSAHAYYLVMARPFDKLYAMTNNLIFAAVILFLLAGTLAELSRRGRRAQA
jgi:hypothetical protein